jgi:hypothetical protein
MDAAVLLPLAGLGLVILALQQTTRPTTRESSSFRTLFFALVGLAGLYLVFTEGPKLLD